MFVVQQWLDNSACLLNTESESCMLFKYRVLHLHDYKGCTLKDVHSVALARLFKNGLSMILKTRLWEEFSNSALGLVLHFATSSSHGCNCINRLPFSSVRAQQEFTKKPATFTIWFLTTSRKVCLLSACSKGGIWNRARKLLKSTFFFFFNICWLSKWVKKILNITKMKTAFQKLNV